MNSLHLNDSFIDQSQLIVQTYSKWCEFFSWNENLFPVYFWQNVLYILTTHQTNPDEFLGLYAVAKEKQVQIVSLTSSSSLHQILWTLWNQNLNVAINEALIQNKFKSTDESSQQNDSKLAKDSTASENPSVSTSASISTSITNSDQSENSAREIIAVQDSTHLSRVQPAEQSIIEPESTFNRISPFLNLTLATDHLEKLKTYFDKSMILIQNKNEAIPVAWSETFENETSSQSTITTLAPNPFYVAFKTKKPFHGYLVSNPVMKTFFDSILKPEEIIENLTVIPLLLDDEVIGYQMSIGQKSCFADEPLQHAMSTAQSLMSDLVQALESKKDVA